MKRFFLPVVIKTWKTEELAGYSKFLGYTRRYVQRKLNPKFYSFPKWVTEDLIRTEKKKKKKKKKPKPDSHSIGLAKTFVQVLKSQMNILVNTV